MTLNSIGSYERPPLKSDLVLMLTLGIRLNGAYNLVM